MTPLLFIRHAETDMAGTFCGHSDPPVNARGEQQIAVLLKALETEEIEAIYTSDLQRATFTAEALAQSFSVPFYSRPGLREIHFGDWEGLTWQEIEQRQPAHALQWSEAYPNLSTPGGEPFATFQARIIAEVEQLSAGIGQRRLAVVTHAGVMRVVLRAFCGTNEKDAWQQTRDYCGFFRYAPEEGS